ncbi:hypothetical protein B0J11DRAFT_592015 [Dendryphion nanum]|uniref:2EXR domain-containing protein n=1 Tax=Dendryphion nanum TaxID=256645 RepID=A0A9P9DE01_9PLEO|nr:hypothetical protein B0J11DRAFT_592015 [Dendryphion nanum]
MRASFPMSQAPRQVSGELKPAGGGVLYRSLKWLRSNKNSSLRNFEQLYQRDLVQMDKDKPSIPQLSPSFWFFPFLPSEMRIKIWHYALDLDLSQRGTAIVSPDGTWFQEGKSSSLLAICKEARYEAQRYQTRLVFKPEPAESISIPTDTTDLNQNPPDQPDQPDTAPSIQSSPNPKTISGPRSMPSTIAFTALRHLILHTEGRKDLNWSKLSLPWHQIESLDLIVTGLDIQQTMLPGVDSITVRTEMVPLYLLLPKLTGLTKLTVVLGDEYFKDWIGHEDYPFDRSLRQCPWILTPEDPDGTLASAWLFFQIILHSRKVRTPAFEIPAFEMWVEDEREDEQRDSWIKCTPAVHVEEREALRLLHRVLPPASISIPRPDIEHVVKLKDSHFMWG